MTSSPPPSVTEKTSLSREQCATWLETCLAAELADSHSAMMIEAILALLRAPAAVALTEAELLALDCGATALQEVGHHLIFKNGAIHSRIAMQELAATLRRLAERGKGR